MKSGIVAALALTLIAGSACAQEWVLGAGFSDFSEELSDDSALLSVEYQHTPFHQGARLRAGWGATATIHTVGDVFVGAGLVGTYDLADRWFLEASVMPGAFFEKPDRNDLGSTFEIRSLIAVGYELESGQALSLALAHKSNASTSSVNPGVNSLLLRWHRRF